MCNISFFIKHQFYAPIYVHMYVHIYIYFVAIVVHFDKSIYGVAKHDGSVQLILTLSKPSPCHITMCVKARDITATGGYIHSYCIYVYIEIS